MESSLISNTNQVYFASVLGMDNEGMVAMFEALISSVLNGFLGCSSAIYEAALVEFFQNASVRDGVVVSTVQGKPVEISEDLFARTFELPMEGLTDMREEPAVETAVLQQEATTSVDDVDNVILRVIAETTKMESNVMKPEVAENIATGTDIEEAVEPRSEDITVEISEESMSIEDLLQQIPGDALLPSIFAAEPMKIKFSNGISIPGVSEGDFYKASIPKIALTDKGKASLVEAGVVQGHPAREMVQLIFGDIEFLIQLREQVIDEVSAFLNSFSLRRLPVLASLTDITVKEEKVLTWAETDSVQIGLQRRLYIVAKYIELLLRKYLESHRAYFSFGQHWSAMALQIIDLLSIAHNAAVNELRMQKKAHALQWTRPCCSMLFEGVYERGFYIPRNHKTIFSTCWIRLVRFVGGSWLWKLDMTDGSAFSTLSLPAVKSLGWHRVCTEVLQFSLIGGLSTVNAINRCIDIVGPLLDIEKIPTSFRGLFQRALNANSFPTFLYDCVEQPEEQGVPEDESSSFDDSVVYRSPSLAAKPSVQISTDIVLQDTVIQPDTDQLTISAFADPSVQLELNQHPDSPTPIDDSSMRFNADDIPLEDDTLVDQISLPVATDRLGDSHNEVLFKINHLEKALVEALSQEDQAFRGLIKNVGQEAQNQADVSSIEIRAVRAQNDLLLTDLVDTQKELGYLVDYINRGGDAKKGESGSSSRPRPPLDDKDRGSGGSRGDRSGSSRNRYFSSGGGPQRRSAEYWFGGK
ncbi:mucin-2-like [Dorcoceras hygrometricum]|uniref:Mucin-2-like n=1 Tax=Dorcoceras hygrometricum TaxID=472368 RepID=A0A2Z7CT39_9LAMI|nr:mucin-2-like [Dorcoceras hygrometricum]